MAKMTKNDLIKAVAAASGINQLAAKAAIEGLTSVISDMGLGDEIPLHGIGKFISKEQPARIGRNPATGAAVEIPARRRLAFKVSKATA